VVLATGDPMWYGIGVTLARTLERDELVILPALSAFSLACARLGWPLAEVETLTLHGRPLDLINGVVYPGARVLALSEDGATPAQVAGRLAELGYGASRLVVLEHMDGPEERVVEGKAQDWAPERLADLNTIAVECVADAGTAARSRLPGLPDQAYRHDGQLTKRELRAVTLAALAPLPGELLWDVGAGCGSVAIEWLRGARGARAVAIERDQGRRALMAENAAALGAPTLAVVAGEAPAALEGLEAPDAVFVGGGLSTDGLLEACWAALGPGGRLVANAVTLEGEARLMAWRGQAGGELRRVAVSRAEAIGALTGWRPLKPVTQLAVVKP
jgi:precorrin-6Y C5,15-methyltransferase (decarboxylating)